MTVIVETGVMAMSCYRWCDCHHGDRHNGNELLLMVTVILEIMVMGMGCYRWCNCHHGDRSDGDGLLQMV